MVLAKRDDPTVSDETAVLGIDLGGTEIKAAVLDHGGAVRWTAEVETRAAEGRDAVLDRIVQLVAAARQEVTPARIERLGIAIPGVVDSAAGRIELLTNLTNDWNGFLVQDALHERTGLDVYLLNDVRAATLAEHTMGAGRAYSDFICIAVGTGVGGGLILNGSLFTGSRGAAGEIGHMTVVADGDRCTCGNDGCLETVAAAPALVRAAHAAIAGGDSQLRELLPADVTPLAIARAAEQGSAAAQAIYGRAGTVIGRALAGLICVLNPQAIVVGGGVARAGNLLIDPIRAEIARRTIVFTPERGGVEVLQSPLDGRAGAMGAAVWASARQSRPL